MGDPIARFEAKITEGPNGCWAWTASLDTSGYGLFWFNGTMAKAHRWSYEYHRSEIPDGLQLDHLCSRRECVNPWHLDPVTCAVNISRGQAGQPQATRTQCPQGHPYDAENTYMTPKGGRDCRTCRRRAWNEYQARKRARAGSI